MAERGDFPEEVETPVGRPIQDGEGGRIIEWEGPEPRPVTYHRDCFAEAASMGIGG